jgi:2,5-diketo-D-gluconate reductase A
MSLRMRQSAADVNPRRAPAMTTLTMNDGRSLPALGIGTYQLPDSQAGAIVRHAIDLGAKMVDTAAIYQNERGVGDGLKGADGVFVQTKLWNDRHDQAEAALDESLALLGLDSVDLYLIHWPHPAGGKFVQAWESLIRLREAGKIRSIGVSNFMPEHIEAIVKATGVKPVLNQIELHPSFQNRALAAYHREQDIITQSWSPLGQGATIKDPRIAEIADQLGVSGAGVIIAWHLAKGYSVIPKSGTPERIADNLKAGEISLSADQIAAIDALDTPDGRMGPDPMTF